MNIWTFNIGTWTLNAIDIIILVICLVRGIVGANRGFFSDFSHTAGIFGGALLAILFTTVLANLIKDVMPNFSPTLISYLSFIALVLVGYIAFRLIGNTLDKVLESLNVSGISTILGFVWGILLSAFTISVFIYILSMQHIFDFSQYVDTSLFASKFIKPLLPLSLDAFKDLVNV